MTPKQRRLKKYRMWQRLIKIKRIGFGLFFITMVIVALTFILRAL